MTPGSIPPVMLLDNVRIGELLPLDDCIACVEEMFRAHALGQTTRPGMLHGETPHGEFHIKAGGVSGQRSYYAVKANAGFFGNRANFGLPNIIGLITLFDGRTGTPLAVLESGAITKMRTGAATAVAARYLARSSASTITVCGAGRQAEVQLTALARILPIRTAYVWARSGAEEFSARMSSHLGLEVSAVTDLAAATRASDVIVTCTPSDHWYLAADNVKKGTFIAAVGSDSPDKQELEPRLVASSRVVPDILEQAAKVGELHHALAEGLLGSTDAILELGSVIVEADELLPNQSDVVIYDSTGTALQDCAAAIRVYERALERDDGDRYQFLRQASNFAP